MKIPFVGGCWVAKSLNNPQQLEEGTFRIKTTFEYIALSCDHNKIVCACHNNSNNNNSNDNNNNNMNIDLQKDGYIWACSSDFISIGFQPGEKAATIVRVVCTLITVR